MRAAAYPLEVINSPNAFSRKRAHARGDGYHSYATAREPGLPADGRSNTMWVGSASALAQLGLKPGQEVTAEALAMALQGKDIDGTQVRVPGPGKKRNKAERGADAEGEAAGLPTQGVVRSYDATFAMKGAGILWVQASAEQREEIQQAMFKASHAMLEHLTQGTAVVRRRSKDGAVRWEVAEGMTAALALHVTARRADGFEVPDPLLHVHAVVTGVERLDGKLVTPQSDNWYKGQARVAGALARLVFADEMIKLGYGIEPDTGRGEKFFRIMGVSEELERVFSKRAQQVEGVIDRLTAELGRPLTPKEISEVAGHTRTAKDAGISEEYVLAEWDRQMTAMGFTAEVAAAMRHYAGYALPLAERQEVVRASVERRMRAEGPTVDKAVAQAMVYEASPGRLTPQEAYDFMRELEKTTFIALEQQRVTTHSIREQERRVMRIVHEAAAAKEPGVSPGAYAHGLATANAKLPEGFTLDAWQEDAYRMLTGGTRWGLLSGLAGTGKGDTLHAVAVAFRTDGWRVVPCALDGTTATRLAEQVGGRMRSRTIEQVLANVKSGSLTVDARTVLVVDEATKIGLEDWERLATLIRDSGARLVAIGHDGQLGAIRLSGMFSAMVEDPGVPTAWLVAIHRHKDRDDPERKREHPWLKDVQVTLNEGNGPAAVALLRKHHAIKLHDTTGDAMLAMVRDWNRWRDRKQTERTVMIAGTTNADIDRLNTLAQEVRLLRGELGEASVRAVDRDYVLRTGDVVILRQGAYNDGSLAERVQNGQMGVVVAVNEQHERVTVDVFEADGSRRRVDFDHAWMRRELLAKPTRAPVLRLGYGHHTFPLMGATVEDAVFLGNPRGGREDAYTAITRARHRLVTHLSRDAGRREWRSDKEVLADWAQSISSSKVLRASMQYGENKHEVIQHPAPSRPQPLPNLSQIGSFEQEVGAQREARVERELAALRERLGPYQVALGDERTTMVVQWAHEARGEVAAMKEAPLRRARAELGEAFEQLDREGALATRRLERDIQIAREALQGAQEQVARRATESRRDAVEAAQKQLATLERAERELGREGRHADGWMMRHGQEAGRWLAVDEELERRALQREQKREQKAAPERHPGELPDPRELGVHVRENLREREVEQEPAMDGPDIGP